MSKRPSTTQSPPSATDGSDGDPFLSRWARRKRMARGGADPDAADQPAPPRDAQPIADPPADGGGEAVPADEAPPPADEDMPPLESIDENTDMSGFFSPRVTQAVKKAALRKFFHNPAFNVVDGLDDYDDDFRSFAALGDIITSDMRSQMEREAERARQAASENPEQAASEPAEQVLADHGDDAPEPAQMAGEHTGDREDAQAGDREEGAAATRLAAGEPGITREPGAPAGPGQTKLRPRGATGKDR